MCLAEPGGRIIAEVEGYYVGVIADAPRGKNGFGYDPLLYLPDAGCTSAELSAEAKNARSHRGRAARLLAQELEELATIPPTG
jgi:XTP/dITP diphosphohydrolase